MNEELLNVVRCQGSNEKEQLLFFILLSDVKAVATAVHEPNMFHLDCNLLVSGHCESLIWWVQYILLIPAPLNEEAPHFK